MVILVDMYTGRFQSYGDSNTGQQLIQTTIQQPKRDFYLNLYIYIYIYNTHAYTRTYISTTT